VLRASERAPGLLVGEGVTLPDDVEIGARVIVHDGTVVGEGVRLLDGAVLGKPVALGARSKAARSEPTPLVVGPGATVGARSIVLAGAAIGPRVTLGDQAHVRERAAIGEESTIGSGSSVDNDVVVGARVRVQTGCYLTAFSEVEDDVFVAPGVTLTNDWTAGRRPRGAPLEGPVLRRGSRIGGGAVILPGVVVGEEAFVGAGAVVTRDVPERTLATGVPARIVREL